MLHNGPTTKIVNDLVKKAEAKHVEETLERHLKKDGIKFDISEMIKIAEAFKEAKLTYIVDANLPKDNIFVFNHEEVRKTNPWHKFRGKTIAFNPSNSAMIELCNLHKIEPLLDPTNETVQK